jgi:hypothetical protein
MLDIIVRFVVYERTSTIWPLKTSSAFWISGSFLKSSLLNDATGGRGGLSGSAAGTCVLAAGGAGAGAGGGSNWASGGFFPRRRFGPDEFYLGVRMAQFRQFRLHQGVILGVIHQRQMIGKFRIKTDGQYVF